MCAGCLEKDSQARHLHAFRRFLDELPARSHQRKSCGTPSKLGLCNLIHCTNTQESIWEAACQRSCTDFNSLFCWRLKAGFQFTRIQPTLLVLLSVRALQLDVHGDLGLGAECFSAARAFPGHRLTRQKLPTE